MCALATMQLPYIDNLLAFCCSAASSRASPVPMPPPPNRSPSWMPATGWLLPPELGSLLQQTKREQRLEAKRVANREFQERMRQSVPAVPVRVTSQCKQGFSHCVSAAGVSFMVVAMICIGACLCCVCVCVCVYVVFASVWLRRRDCSVHVCLAAALVVESVSGGRCRDHACVLRLLERRRSR